LPKGAGDLSEGGISQPKEWPSQIGKWLENQQKYIMVINMSFVSRYLPNT